MGRDMIGWLPVPAWGRGAGRASTLRGSLQNQHHFAVFFQSHGFRFHILERRSHTHARYTRLLFRLLDQT